jgi:hypothetical protein
MEGNHPVSMVATHQKNYREDEGGGKGEMLQ